MNFNVDVPANQTEFFGSNKTDYSMKIIIEQQNGSSWTAVSSSAVIKADGASSLSFMAGAADGTYRVRIETYNTGAYKPTFDSSTFAINNIDLKSYAVGGYNVADTSTTYVVSGNVRANDTGAKDASTSKLSIALDQGAYQDVTGAVTINGKYGKLVINADGGYTYDPTNSIYNLGKTEVFNYKLTTVDGNSTDTSSLSINIESTGVIMNSTDTATTLTGTSGDDLLISRGGNETITTSGGHDTVIFNLLKNTVADATGGNGHDTWTDFTKGLSNASGDVIDIKGLLSDQTGVNAGNIGNYVKVAYNGTDTVISIDRDGTGANYSSADLLTLKNTNTTLAELLQNNQLLF